MTASLCLNDVSVNRGAKKIISSVCLDLPIGQILGVLGPNGAGKTTLLSACTGEIALTHGSVHLGDQPVSRIHTAAMARQRAVLTQSSQLTFNLPVKELVQIGAYPFPEVAPVVVDQWVAQAIDIACISDFLDKSFMELSGGEQQRVQFARVVVQTLAISAVNGQAFLFLDEPTASLDLKHQGQLIRAVRHLVEHHRVAAFVILHDLNMAARWCDQILLLSPEQAPLSGSPRTVLNKANLDRAYKVEVSVCQHPSRPSDLLILTHDQ